ncbi:MAG: hypothetical protein U5J63_13915 [Fodinibius sp.]|nr:hypothetical protein [Fodinibius sp.]
MERKSIESDISVYYLWNISLGCFIVAAITGFLYRLGIVGGLPASWGLALDNIRHAHSHLMFFGWAVPFPLVILFNYLVSQDSNPRAGVTWMRYSIAGALIFGVLSYPFFLLYGYRPVAIGSSSLPLSVIFSGLVMICWYAFFWGYRKLRALLDGDASQAWIDGALVMLFVSSLGAWGVAVVQAVVPNSHLLMKSLTHFFLATFTEGWVVLVLVAIVVMQLQPQASDWKLAPNVWLGCIAIGAPLTFPYGISESLLSPMLLLVARLGGGLAAIGLLGVSYTFWASGKWKHKLWGWIVGLLAFKALMQLVASVAPSSFWLSDHGLRIFYLHVLLLGALTLTLSAWLQNRFQISETYFHIVVISVFAVLVSLVLPTSFWPVNWGGAWIFQALVAAALLPPLAMGAQWIAITTSKKNTP